MSNATRKCSYCGASIDVSNINDLSNVAYYKNKYYHRKCLLENAKKRIEKNDRFSPVWRVVAKNIDDYIEIAKKILQGSFYTDELNRYLIKQYNIATLSHRFWTTIKEINGGSYKGRICKEIDCKTLLEMWEFYQLELDKIHKRNIQLHKQMHGEQRLVYDLAIIMNKYNEYSRKKAQIVATAIAQKNEIKNFNQNIDFAKLPKANNQKRVIDMSDYMEELY